MSEDVSVEADVEKARRWTVNVLGNVPYLYANQVRGIIANRARYPSMQAMSDGDFLHGLYLGLCDHFNGGCELEDVSLEVSELLGLPVTEDTPISASYARRLEDEAGFAADRARMDRVRAQSGGFDSRWIDEKLVAEGKLEPYEYYSDRKHRLRKEAAHHG